MQYHELSFKLFETDFLSNQKDELVIALNFHKKIDEDKFKLEASKLKADFLKEGLSVNFIGRAKNNQFL